MDYSVFPPEEIIEATVELPLSKSIAARVLTINAIAKNPLPKLPHDVADDITLIGKGLYAQNSECINVEGSGTALRFLTAFYAGCPGKEITLDGSQRIRQRPMRQLVDSLKQLGAKIEYLDAEGFAPLKIYGRRLQGGKIEIDATISSQFISALLLIAPYMIDGLELKLEGDAVSKPYIDMTVELMKQYGAEVSFEQNLAKVEPSLYCVDSLYEEKDWSASAFWAEIVALSAGFVSLPSLTLHSLQGDTKVTEFFGRLGVNFTEAEECEGIELCGDPEIFAHIDLDLSAHPDLAMSIAVTCCLLNIPFHLTGLDTLRLKETDRIEALHNELLKLGCITEISPSSIAWEGRFYPISQLPVIDTYNDHRIAMAFAPAALLIPGIVIRNVEVVGKSYPDFWRQLETAGFTLQEYLPQDAVGQ